jgi:hypothetical protein
MLCNYTSLFSFMSSIARASLVIGLLWCSGVKAEDGPVMASGWNWRVFQTGLRLVDNIVVADKNTLYATLERSPGRGQLASIRNGTVSILIDRLDRPDGLAMAGDTLYLTEEVMDGRVLSYQLKTGELKELARLRKPEGIDILAPGSLVLAEDVGNGRLVQLDGNGKLTVLASGLKRPEGLRVSGDGTIYRFESGIATGVGV